MNKRVSILFLVLLFGSFKTARFGGCAEWNLLQFAFDNKGGNIYSLDRVSSITSQVDKDGFFWETPILGQKRIRAFSDLSEILILFLSFANIKDQSSEPEDDKIFLQSLGKIINELIIAREDFNESIGDELGSERTKQMAEHLYGIKAGLCCVNAAKLIFQEKIIQERREFILLIKKQLARLELDTPQNASVLKQKNLIKNLLWAMQGQGGLEVPLLSCVLSNSDGMDPDIFVQATGLNNYTGEPVNFLFLQ